MSAKGERSDANTRTSPRLSGSSKRLGLIINPIAGIGGRVGLKGSDGKEIQKLALDLGAVPQSENRTIEALERIKSADDLQIITYPGKMGAHAARACGFEPLVIGLIQNGKTTSQDTQDAARDMLQMGVDLLLFAGGDGTARDVYQAIGDRLPALGIPTGVKIHSAVFGSSPRNAGDLALSFLQDRATSLREAEVMDIDEAAFRQGLVSAKLYGYLKIPFQRRLVQSLKAASSPGELAAMTSIACDVVDRMKDEYLYVIGPGTTTRAITAELGLHKTLIGVDVVLKRKLIATDVNESQLLQLVQDRSAKIVVTPIGGQGFIFGRGNQQISHRIIAKVGFDNIIIVSTTTKIHSLRGRPLLVDTGDRAVDEMLCGYKSIVTGYNEEMVYRVSC